ncbi:MAG: hypothetical protein ICV59_07585 [Thermoleophilia bacterium]|nr:hypothetical protein [Thermoleophilia bacterium]
MDDLTAVQKFRYPPPTTDAAGRATARARLDEAIAAAGRRRARRRVWLVAATSAVAAAAAAVSAAATGVQDRVFDLFAGKPAGPAVRERLLDEVNAERITPIFDGTPGARTEDARAVTAITTMVGPVILWVVPTDSGPTCAFVEVRAVSERAGKPRGESACLAQPSPGGPIVLSSLRSTVEGRPLVVVFGWVAETVASLALVAPDRSERDISVVDRFFLAELPREHERHALVARAATGQELERMTVSAFSLDAWSQIFNRIVTGPERTLIETVNWRGKRLRLAIQPAEGGEECLIIEVAGGRGTSCGRRLGVREGISASLSHSGPYVYLNGSVGPEIDSLELRFQDGEAVAVPIAEGFVLHDIPRARYEEGERPFLLVGRNAAGEIVAEERLGQTSFAKNSSIWR